MQSPERETSLITAKGERLLNISYHEGRVLVDIRRRLAGGDWVPYAELSFKVHEWNRFARAICEYDVELELFLEDSDEISGDG
tara:strand:+ start:18 stop:266 length:249 start_codon:yes stop_codon:yes gene_type:complete